MALGTEPPIATFQELAGIGPAGAVEVVPPPTPGSNLPAVVVAVLRMVAVAVAELRMVEAAAGQSNIRSKSVGSIARARIGNTRALDSTLSSLMAVPGRYTRARWKNQCCILVPPDPG
ncbi:hypothetical protein AB4090_05905 [Acidithiobacillus sp. IBUN Pt1247-S3]